MAIDPEKLLALQLPEVRQSYDWRDSVLYALGCGQGLDPLDQDQLKYVDETRLSALPTMATLLGHPGFWVRDLDTGIDWVNIVHGEQSLVMHQPLKPAGDTISSNRIIELVDKGAGRGAMVFVERVVRDAQTGAKIATLVQNIFCRSDGGFGGSSEASQKLSAVPVGDPDQSLTLQTSPQSALIFRLSGDLNPLHSDPEVAAKAGFPQPILHGLATFGLVGAGLVTAVCGGDAGRLRAMRGRFSSPVFPGEALRLDVWKKAHGTAAFSATVIGRNVTAISHGSCEHN